MRVNIMYSIDLENVPNEVVKHLDEVQEKHESISYKFDNAASTINSGSFTEAMKKIVEIREQLAREDIRLQECLDILLGYQQALINEQNDQPVDQPVEEKAGENLEEG